MLNFFFRFTMSRIYVKPYSDYIVSGEDFQSVSSKKMRRIVFSPNNTNSIIVNELRDGCLLITNERRIPFQFSISSEAKTLATVDYSRTESALFINSNWKLNSKGVFNQNENSDEELNSSPQLNFDFKLNGIGRIDLKIDESGFAACIFSNSELLFVRMNGNYSVPRLLGFIRNEAEHLLMDDTNAKKQIGTKFFQKWVGITKWGSK